MSNWIKQSRQNLCLEHSNMIIKREGKFDQGEGKFDQRKWGQIPPKWGQIRPKKMRANSTQGEGKFDQREGKFNLIYFSWRIDIVIFQVIFKWVHAFWGSASSHFFHPFKDKVRANQLSLTFSKVIGILQMVIFYHKTRLLVRSLQLC